MVDFPVGERGEGGESDLGGGPVDLEVLGVDAFAGGVGDGAEVEFERGRWSVVGDAAGSEGEDGLVLAAEFERDAVEQDVERVGVLVGGREPAAELVGQGVPVEGGLLPRRVARRVRVPARP